MISERLSSIRPSASLSITKTVAEMKAKNIHIYNFGIGEPDFTTPEGIIDYSYECSRSGMTHYTPSSGLPELRDAIAQKLRKFNNIDGASADEIVVSPTKFTIYATLLALLNPGEEVLIPEPYYLSYPDIVRLSGGKPVPFRTPDDFSLDLSEAEKLVSPRTRVFIYNSPVNPTGKVFTEKEVKGLVDFVVKNDLYLISDEIYENIIFRGKHISPASFDEIRDRTITVSGFSKSHAMTGWRIGYLHAPREIAKACDLIQQQTITCAPSVSQTAAIEALRDTESPVRFTEKFRERMHKVVKLLREIDGINVIEPEGTFYAFPKYDLNMDSVDFASSLLKESNVAVTPGTAFGESGERHFRLSFATSDEDIENGISALSGFIRNRKRM
ncbi:MAG: pyridoxal phosphate-dependent aminotransferase [Candidatus Thermoplasmatota archaeon]|nr:pyridoxal phosphate-dependent aminotransferase [Candidatus Thermoplasmatota archaeon]MCL5730672.1 pyridoxal phosphate-dependent aminotransferase [Candidatus Thermoplasmatota archaeon]